MTAVIAGCGDLGARIGLLLAEQGHRVVGLRRRAELVPAPIEGWSVDLTAPVPDLPEDTEIVVIATAATERSVEGYRRAYVETLARVLDAVRRLSTPPRLLLVSSTGVYQTSDGSWVDEQSPVADASGTAAVLVEAEELLRARHADAVILRLGGIYGPGRDRLPRQVRAGQVLTNPERHINLIHIDDAAAAAVHLLGLARPAPVYLGVDGAPATRREIADFIAAELGVPASPRVVEPEVLAGKRCRGELLRSTGFAFRYPTYREGYRSALAGEDPLVPS